MILYDFAAYSEMFGNIRQGGNLVKPKCVCMSQCTGCMCNCRCACRGGKHESDDFIWESF